MSAELTKVGRGGGERQRSSGRGAAGKIKIQNRSLCRHFSGLVLCSLLTMMDSNRINVTDIYGHEIPDKSKKEGQGEGQEKEVQEKEGYQNFDAALIDSH